MKYRTMGKQVGVIIAPFFGGWVINSSLFMIDLYSRFLWLLTIAMTLYWWCAGRYFSKAYDRQLKGIMIGNSLWGISLLLFIFEFLILSDKARHMLLAVYSQCYGLFFVPFGAALLSPFSSMNSSIVVLIAYGVMLLIFVLGYNSNKNNAFR